MSSEPLFKVCHSNGKEWTYRELEEFAKNNRDLKHLYSYGINGFSIDEDGFLTLTDESGNWAYIEGDFNIVWNRKIIWNRQKIRDESDDEA